MVRFPVAHKYTKCLFFLATLGCVSERVDEHWPVLEEITDLSRDEFGLTAFPGAGDFSSGRRSLWRGKARIADLPAGFWDFEKCIVAADEGTSLIAATIDVRGAQFVLLRSGEIVGKGSEGTHFAYSDESTASRVRDYLSSAVGPEWRRTFSSFYATKKQCVGATRSEG
ncbi:hypothetical protein [Albidovulum sediminis]|uniref:Lipoprotein n=1 Tax=Albidovulum sediminis TaxID=3066345 RepID=A0ABT2NS39_9RHOB|nr:hypothetical protein [Defluviimonas sediminis]MCT8330898.1 hypothetical protein [Defluviimonas sediminis]